VGLSVGVLRSRHAADLEVCPPGAHPPLLPQGPSKRQEEEAHHEPHLVRGIPSFLFSVLFTNLVIKPSPLSISSQQHRQCQRHSMLERKKVAVWLQSIDKASPPPAAPVVWPLPVAPVPVSSPLQKRKFQDAELAPLSPSPSGGAALPDKIDKINKLVIDPATPSKPPQTDATYDANIDDTPGVASRGRVTTSPSSAPSASHANSSTSHSASARKQLVRMAVLEEGFDRAPFLDVDLPPDMAVVFRNMTRIGRGIGVCPEATKVSNRSLYGPSPLRRLITNYRAWCTDLAAWIPSCATMLAASLSTMRALASARPSSSPSSRF